MKIVQDHETKFETEHTLRCAALTGGCSWVMLLSNGQVADFNGKTGSGNHLFSVSAPDNITYRDGGFDLEAACSLYTMDSIVVVVNDYKTHGHLFYPEKKHKVHLWREDYHASHSRYPIALFRDADDIPHLIYSTQWNRVDIMNLDTLQIRTADKSLIEENAEERHTSFYSQYPGHSHHPWPRPYDYFYGTLTMAPDNTRFLSCGWVWGSSDALRLYEVDHFLASNRIASKTLMSAEHLSRPACWINNNTVAVLYDPKVDDDDLQAAVQLKIYDIRPEEPECIRQFSVEGSVDGKLYYSEKHSAFVLLNTVHGTKVFASDGSILLQEPDLKPDAFYPELDLFLTAKDKTITIHKLEA